MQDKHDLRAILTARRGVAFGASPVAGSLLVAQFPSELLVSDHSVIAAYMPFRTEIDPLPLLRVLVARGGQAAMPRIGGRSSPSPPSSTKWGGVGVGGLSEDGALLEVSSLPRDPPSPSPFPTKGKGKGSHTALTFHLCDPDNENHFIHNKWGLLEPRADLPQATPSILLVPLLGFDRRGQRLGYGKGFYDEAIARLRSEGPVIAIGLAFAAQEVPQIRTQPHDQRLDWIITQNEAYRVPS